MLHTEEAPQGTRLVVDTLSCLIAKEADPSRIMAQVSQCTEGWDYLCRRDLACGSRGAHVVQCL